MDSLCYSKSYVFNSLCLKVKVEYSKSICSYQLDNMNLNHERKMLTAIGYTNSSFRKQLQSVTYKPHSQLLSIAASKDPPTGL